MTDEELADEYIKKNNLEWELECNRTSPIDEVKQAYLAGLNKALDIKDASDRRLEPILYKLKDLGVIVSWYKNDTYHAC